MKTTTMALIQLRKLYDNVNKIKDINFSTIRSFYKELSDFKINCTQLREDQIIQLIDCCILYVKCLVTYVQLHKPSDKKHIEDLKKCLEVVTDFSRIEEIKNGYVTCIMDPLLGIIVRFDTKKWFSAALIRNFLVVINGTKEELRHIVGNSSINYLYKIFDEMRAYGDYEQQLLLMKITFAMFSRDFLKLHAHSLLPESKLLQKAFVEINGIHLFYETRKFLNDFNSKHKKILSFKFDDAITDNEQIQPPTNFIGNSHLWVDFNISSESLSIFCKKRSFLLNKDYDNNMDIVKILFKDLNMVEMSKLTKSNLNSTRGSLIFFRLNRPQSVIRKDLKLVLFDNGQIEILEKDVLPLLFKDKFQKVMYSAQEGKTNRDTSRNKIGKYQPLNIKKTEITCDSDLLSIPRGKSLKDGVGNKHVNVLQNISIPTPKKVCSLSNLKKKPTRKGIDNTKKFFYAKQNSKDEDEASSKHSDYFLLNNSFAEIPKTANKKLNFEEELDVIEISDDEDLIENTISFQSTFCEKNNMSVMPDTVTSKPCQNVNDSKTERESAGVRSRNRKLNNSNQMSYQYDISNTVNEIINSDKYLEELEEDLIQLLDWDHTTAVERPSELQVSQRRMGLTYLSKSITTEEEPCLLKSLNLGSIQKIDNTKISFCKKINPRDILNNSGYPSSCSSINELSTQKPHLKVIDNIELSENEDDHEVETSSVDKNRTISDESPSLLENGNLLEAAYSREDSNQFSSSAPKNVSRKNDVLKDGTNITAVTKKPSTAVLPESQSIFDSERSDKELTLESQIDNSSNEIIVDGYLGDTKLCDKSLVLCTFPENELNNVTLNANNKNTEVEISKTVSDRNSPSNAVEGNVLVNSKLNKLANCGTLDVKKVHTLEKGETFNDNNENRASNKQEKKIERKRTLLKFNQNENIRVCKKVSVVIEYAAQDAVQKFLQMKKTSLLEIENDEIMKKNVLECKTKSPVERSNLQDNFNIVCNGNTNLSVQNLQIEKRTRDLNDSSVSARSKSSFITSKRVKLHNENNNFILEASMQIDNDENNMLMVATHPLTKNYNPQTFPNPLELSLNGADRATVEFPNKESESQKTILEVTDVLNKNKSHDNLLGTKINHKSPAGLPLNTDGKRANKINILQHLIINSSKRSKTIIENNNAYGKNQSQLHRRNVNPIKRSKGGKTIGEIIREIKSNKKFISLIQSLSAQMNIPLHDDYKPQAKGLTRFTNLTRRYSELKTSVGNTVETTNVIFSDDNLTDIKQALNTNYEEFSKIFMNKCGNSNEATTELAGFIEEILPRHNDNHKLLQKVRSDLQIKDSRKENLQTLKHLTTLLTKYFKEK